MSLFDASVSSPIRQPRSFQLPSAGAPETVNRGVLTHVLTETVCKPETLRVFV
jgi:hypothetical protein